MELRRDLSCGRIPFHGTLARSDTPEREGSVDKILETVPISSWEVSMHNGILEALRSVVAVLFSALLSRSQLIYF